jgi:hypothetical protein
LVRAVDILRGDQAARLGRLLALAATGVILGLAVAVFVQVWSSDSDAGNIGEDFNFYVSLGRRWLDSGVMYGARQLTGQPYHIEINVDNLYPPPVILFFAAFVYLPWVTWYLVPIGLVAYAIWRLRPAAWAWPLMAFCVLWPRTQGSFVVGNSDLWSAGLVAAGTIWGWPSVLGLFKPAFAPVVLIGFWRRSWWIALAAVGVLSVPFLAYWQQYVVVATNWEAPITRSLPNVPILFIPIFAWLGRTRPGSLYRSFQATIGSRRIGTSWKE